MPSSHAVRKVGSAPVICHRSMNCARLRTKNFSTGSFRTLVTLSHLASFIAATFHRFDKLQSKIQNNVANALRTLSAIQTLFHEYYTRTFTDTIPIFTSILSFHYLYQIFAVWQVFYNKRISYDDYELWDWCIKWVGWDYQS